MIERYSRPAMKAVWSEENKFNKWLEVEIAACEAWAQLGVVPRTAIPKIKLARVNLKRMDEILKETHHDVTAFLNTVAESIGEESRYIHSGDDVIRCHGYRLKSAINGSNGYFSGRYQRIDRGIGRACHQVQEYTDGGAHPRRACRTDYFRVKAGHLV
jgi:hypothetical protein